jgi:hypothetical protein
MDASGKVRLDRGLYHRRNRDAQRGRESGCTGRIAQRFCSRPLVPLWFAKDVGPHAIRDVEHKDRREREAKQAKRP